MRVSYTVRGNINVYMTNEEHLELITRLKQRHFFLEVTTNSVIFHKMSVFDNNRPSQGCESAGFIRFAKRRQNPDVRFMGPTETVHTYTRDTLVVEIPQIGENPIVLRDRNAGAVVRARPAAMGVAAGVKEASCRAAEGRAWRANLLAAVALVNEHMRKGLMFKISDGQLKVYEEMKDE